MAVGEAVAASAQSILVSGVSFFASTFGVGAVFNVDIISSMCSLIARGALLLGGGRAVPAACNAAALRRLHRPHHGWHEEKKRKFRSDRKKGWKTYEKSMR